MLYRVNRVIPLYTVLPITLFHLRQTLPRLLDDYWASTTAELQYLEESQRFAAWLSSLPPTRVLPAALDALHFEMACSSLLSNPDDSVRDLYFNCDPAEVLAKAADPQPLESPTTLRLIRLDGRFSIADPSKIKPTARRWRWVVRQ